MIWTILEYTCLIIGGLTLSSIIYFSIIYPSYDYLKSQYMYYIKHSAFEYDKSSFISFFLPHGKYISFEEYKNKYGNYPNKIKWWKFKCYNPW